MYLGAVTFTADDSAAPSSEFSAQHARALRAIQLLSDAMDHMHGSMTQSMEINASDLRALRIMSIKHLRGEEVTPFGLSEHLGMSTAATAALIRRLVDHGYLRRRPHPTDRRSQVLTLTEEARETFHHHFGDHLRTMREVIAQYPPEHLAAVCDFMERLAQRLAGSAAPPQSTPS